MRKLYYSYIMLAILYVLVKVVFISFGYLHTGAILHGSIPAALTLLAGILLISGSKKANYKLRAWLATILPVLVLIVTPVYMYLKKGDDWLTNGRLSVLIIYEALAIFQLIIGFIIIRKHISAK
jgi:peptidoglycan/LPS O-acetylase OafA/YrhL